MSALSKDSRKVVLITGASSGLGMGMAKLYAKQGKHLILCARRLDRLVDIKKQLEQRYTGVQIRIYSLDVNDHDAVFTTFEDAAKAFGRIDRIIVNAGVGKGASVGTGYFSVNKQTAFTNFISALAQCEAALQIFRRQDFGHLVTISSISAVRGFRRAMTVYAASKAALSNLSEGIRVDLGAESEIKVSTIHPGFIKSELNEKVEKMPFLIDLERGSKLLIEAIAKEKHSAYVPAYPWAIMHYLLRVAPLSILRKLS